MIISKQLANPVIPQGLEAFLFYFLHFCLSYTQHLDGFHLSYGFL